MKHQCPFCFKEMECDATRATKQFYKPFKEQLPKDEDIMTGEDIKRMRESIFKRVERL